MLADREGQVDRFYKRLQVRQEYVADLKAQAEAKTSPERPISELEISTRAINALTKAGLHTVGDMLAKLEAGEDALLDIDGFGRKSLIEVKKQLRKLGYKLPSAAESSED